MKVSELPQKIQDRLAKEREALCLKNVNGPYRIHLYNKEGTRYFTAVRMCHEWSDDKGHYMHFGNGTHWELQYGKVVVRRFKSVMATDEYELEDGPRFNKSANGTEIWPTLDTKKEVLDVIKKIGIFDI